MLKNSAYNLIGGFLKLVINIFAVPVLIGCLGIKGYGLLSIILSVINFVALTENSISLTLTVFLSQKEYNRRLIQATSIYIILILSVITIFVFVIVVYFSASLFPNLSFQDLKQFKLAVSLGVPIIIARFFHQFFIGVEQSHQAYKLINMISTIYILLQVVGNILIALIYSSIVYIFIWQAVISWFFVLIHSYCCRIRNIFFWNKLPLIFDLKIFKKIWVFSYKAFVGTFGSVMFTQGDKLLIGNLLGTEVAGIYSALTSITYQINVVSALPVQPLIPIISSKYANKEGGGQDVINNSMSKAIFLNFIISLGIGSFLILFAPEIYTLVIQKYTYDITTLLPFYILIFIYSIYSLNAVGYFVLYSIGKENFNIGLSIFAGLFSLLLIMVLSPKLGLLGSCIGNCGFIITLVLLIRAIKLLNFPIKTFWSIVLIPIIGFVLSLLSIVIRDSLSQRIIFSFILFCLCCITYFNKIKYYYYIIKK